MAEIFVSYKTEDRPRIAHLVSALRDAGFDIWWDQDIPAGGGWRETIAAELDAANLCVVAWSQSSTGGGGRFVREEAERAAGRGAYLGVLIDPVMPPFGFAEWQSIDLSRWNGKDGDPLLDHFVAQVRARLANRPAPQAAAAPPSRPRAVWPVAAAGALLVLLAAAILLWQFWPGTADPGAAAAQEPTEFVDGKLASFPCSWLQIGNYQRRPDGAYLALHGIAGSPQSVQTSIMHEAAEQSVAIAELDIADVATAPPQTCSQLELMRRYMRPGRSRLTILSQRALERDSDGQWGYFEYELDLAAIPRSAILLGLDDGGGVKVLIPDLRAARPVRTEAGRSVYGALYTDENRGVRNVGLILMTATGAIDQRLVERIGSSSDRAGMQALVREAAGKGWQFELGLVHCGFESGGRRRC